MAIWLTRFLKRETNCERVVKKETRVSGKGDFGLKVLIQFLRLTICSVCIGRTGLGLQVFSTDSICIFVTPHALVAAI